MITCVVEYEIRAEKVADFERFAKAWMRSVDKHGGRHHGYFLPSRARATAPWPCSVLTVSPPTRLTALASASTPSSFKPTKSAIRPDA